MTDEQKLKDIVKAHDSLEHNPKNLLRGVLYDEDKGSIIFEYQSGQDIKVKVPERRSITKFEGIKAFIKSLFKQ